jgi:hypothetical protein
MFDGIKLYYILLTLNNLKRELNGILKAMKFFNQTNAVIMTFANSYIIEENGCNTEVFPAYKYLLNN